MKEFFERTNVHYLTGKFGTSLELNAYQGLDYSAMKEVFVEKVRNYVIDNRKDWSINSAPARIVYDECVHLDISEIAPKHPYDTWDLECWAMSVEQWKSVFHSAEEFNEWCYDNIQDIYLPNRDYEYLYRVVEAVREAVINLEEK